MFDIKNIVEPNSLTEALKIYDSNPMLQIIAGGTDVLINLRHGKLEEVELLSLKNVKELTKVEITDDETISIGACASFTSIHRNEIILNHLPILAEAAVSMGGPQIRNVATIGGNICNGAVSADSAPTLFTLNAKLRLVSLAGARIVPIQDFYQGPGKVKINKGEILTNILITKDNYVNMSGKYIKFSNRKAMDIAMISVAVLCNVRNGKFEDLRIALGVAAPTPIRCGKAEEYAKGKLFTDEIIKEIGLLTLQDANPRNSWRGSKDYREHLINTLTQRGIKEACGGYRNE